MTILKSIEDVPTKFKHNEIFEQYKNEIENISITQYANMLKTTKQNISIKIKNNSFLLYKEQNNLLDFLKNNNQTHCSLYKKLYSRNNENFSEATTLPLKTENFYNKVTISNNILDYLKATKNLTEVIFAEGDSMFPEINNNDMLLIDKSQTDITNGCTYVFNYNGELMCKQLNQCKQAIMAISKNSNYLPFIIDNTLDFKIIGRVVGTIHPVN